MKNLKLIVASKNHFNRIINALQEVYPEAKEEPNLTYKKYTKYLYLDSGVIRAGSNAFVFMKSNSEYITFDKLMSTTANTKVTEQCTDLMIDIETLGTKSGEVILSIGAVFFNMETGFISKHSFYSGISLESSLNAGFKINPKTLAWWSNQDSGAYKEALIVGTLSLEQVLENFKLWLDLQVEDLPAIQVWGNSARFDLGMLDAYYNYIKEDVPWNYYLERDVRTLVMFAPHIKDTFVTDKDGNSATTHKPVEDCINQIKYCSKIFEKIEVHE